jgi:hypothetical protein
MSAEVDVIYSKKPYLLTLKGRITVHYLDGQTIEGEIVAQDELNIWLTVDDAPHLISRSQIRYIKGNPGQQIEAEDSQAVESAVPPAVLQTAVSAPSEPQPETKVAQFVEEVEEAPTADDLGGTVVIPAPSAKAPLDEENLDETAPVIDELADTGMTVILDTNTDLAAVTVAETKEHEGGDSVTGPDVASLDTDDTELLPQLELDDDEPTYVLRESDEKTSLVHLICTTGPHAGEVFELKQGVTTLGRSSDNAVALYKDKEASRHHAIIVYEASKFVIQDQNSLNGTIVNDQIIKDPRPLLNGDVVLIGVSTLKFQER